MTKAIKISDISIEGGTQQREHADHGFILNGAVARGMPL